MVRIPRPAANSFCHPAWGFSTRRGCVGRNLRAVGVRAARTAGRPKLPLPVHYTPRQELTWLQVVYINKNSEQTPGMVQWGLLCPVSAPRWWWWGNCHRLLPAGAHRRCLTHPNRPPLGTICLQEMQEMPSGIFFFFFGLKWYFEFKIPALFPRRGVQKDTRGQTPEEWAWSSHQRQRNDIYRYLEERQGNFKDSFISNFVWA